MASPCLRAFHSIPPHSLILTLFLSCLIECYLSAGRCEGVVGGGDKVVPFRTKHSVSCYQHSDKLWVSVLTSVHCKRKLHWPRFSSAKVYGYKHKYLEGNLTTDPLKQAVADSTWRLCATIASWVHLKCKWVCIMWSSVPVQTSLLSFLSQQIE